MSLQKQYWEMIFGQAGRDKRVDEKVLESPNLTELINGEIIQPGKIQKRNGYVTVESDQTDDYGLSVGARTKRGDILVALCDYKISDFNAALEWTNGATSLLAVSEAKNLISDVKYTFSNIDIAYYNGYYYVVATKTLVASSSGYLYVYDSNFSPIAEEVVISGDIPLKLVVYSSSVAVISNDGSGNIYLQFVNQSTFALGSQNTVTSSANTTYTIFDVDTDGTLAYVAFSNSTGVAVAAVLSSGSVDSVTGLGGTGVADKAIAIHVNVLDPTTYFLMVCNSSTGESYGLRNLTTGAWDDSGIGGSITDAENMVIATWRAEEYVVGIQRPGTTTIESYIYLFGYIDSLPINLGNIWGSGIVHKAVGYTTTDDILGPFFGLCRQQTNFSVNYTVQVKTDYASTPEAERVEPVAKYMYRMSSGIGGGVPNGGAVSNCVEGHASDTYYFGAVNANGDLAVCSFSYAASGTRFQRRFHTVQIGDDVIISGSIPLIWDGKIAREVGFSHPPAIVDDTVTGSGSIADGDYNYILVYKIKDNSGRVYRSLMSAPYSVNVSGHGGSGFVTLDVIGAIYRPDWDIDQDEHRLPTIEAYRTVDGPGSIYYYASEISVTTYHGWFSDDYTSTPPTIGDGSSDATIINNAILYTTGGVLEQCAPPPLDDVIYYDNRIWGIDSETGNIVYSAELLEGEGPWFNAAYVVQNPSNIGKPIKLIDTQSFILVLYKDNIGAIYGQGYNNLGTDGNLTTVKILVNNLGCIEQKSVAKIPTGIIFKSSLGFHLMGYDGSIPQYIGSGVSDYDDSIVVSADVIRDKKHVRFALTANDEPLLVYNYEFNQWYIWGWGNGYGGDVSDRWCTKTGGYVVGSAHYLVNGDTGNTLIQDTGYLDGIVDGSYSEEHYSFSITTPWIKLAGLQGYKRVLKAWILGTYESQHDLDVEIDYDYDDTNTDTVSITDVGSYVDTDLYQVRIGIPKQRCQSIRFKITVDTSSYSEGAGATLTGLRFEYMQKKGGMRSPNFG